MSLSRRQFLAGTSVLATYPMVAQLSLVSGFDQSITGHFVHRSSSDLTVAITSPYQNLTNGLHIPYFARQHSSFLGEPGDQTACRLLQDLYKLGRFLDKNMQSLRLALKEAGDPVLEGNVAFFREQFPMTISYSSRPEVLDILTGRRPLESNFPG